MHPNQFYIDISLKRPDLSHWGLHLVGGKSGENISDEQSGVLTLHKILNQKLIKGSMIHCVQKYSPLGATCFYDAPPAVWPIICQNNISGRSSFGIICAKKKLWEMGGRPAIYSLPSDPKVWPDEERFRVVEMDPTSDTYPSDWTSEREWRIAGDLTLSFPQPKGSTCWWWPLVPNQAAATQIFAEFPSIHSVYTLSNSLLQRGFAGA